MTLWTQIWVIIGSGNALLPDQMAPSHRLNRCWLSLPWKLCGGIHMRAVSREVLMDLINNKYWEITLLKLLLYLPGANELTSGIKQLWTKCLIKHHITTVIHVLLIQSLRPDSTLNINCGGNIVHVHVHVFMWNLAHKFHAFTVVPWKLSCCNVWGCSQEFVGLILQW